jgi:NitT/TauT family transport system permease protein
VRPESTTAPANPTAVPVASDEPGPSTRPTAATSTVSSASKDVRRRTIRRRLLVHGVRLVVVALIVGGWEFAANHWIDPFYYSKPSRIWTRLISWFTDGTASGSIWEQITVTLEEAVLGFVIGSLAGIVLGVLLGRARFLAEVSAPFIKAANAIPRIVLASLFVIWFGLGMASKVATAVVLVFFAVFFNAFQGAREVDRTFIDNARILGAGRRQVLTSIVLPSATTWILASLHVAFGFALIGAVVGEYTGADRGLGLLIANAQGTFDAAGIYAAMILITVIALAAESLLTLAERRLLSWQPAATHQGAQL